jgi:hypothetical protein
MLYTILTVVSRSRFRPRDLIPSCADILRLISGSKPRGIWSSQSCSLALKASLNPDQSQERSAFGCSGSVPCGSGLRDPRNVSQLEVHVPGSCVPGKNGQLSPRNTREYSNTLSSCSVISAHCWISGSLDFSCGSIGVQVFSKAVGSWIGCRINDEQN